MSIPPNILELFESKDKANVENKNKTGSRTSVTSHSTVDSRAPGGQGMNFGNQPNIGATGGTPVNNMNPSEGGMRFQSFNSLLNQSNDFLMMNKGQGADLNTSNMSNKDSRNMSLNNLSRDSGHMDLNTSNRRNTSSRANAKTSKNYQVTLNEDISLIERIEIMLNQITMNHNKSCPFCSKIIDIKKCNFQNISALLSNTSKKYYLTHFDCYLKSNSNPASAKIIPLTNIVEARVNSQINSLSNIDTSNFLRSDRRAYFVSIEGYHPISSSLLFRIDKICHGLEHATHRNQMLYLNLVNKSSSIFEPTSYMVPYSEFRMVVTIHMSHASEDPFTYEYLIDFSQVKLSSDQKNKFAEVHCFQDGNSIMIASQIVFDPNSELSSGLNYKMNLDSSFQSTGSAANPKPDFGKNVFVSFKYFTISLPLKRIERRIKESIPASTPVVEETLYNKVAKPTQMISPMNVPLQQQKKPHSRLQLNPNAPLFSNASGQPQSFEPQRFEGPQQQFGPGAETNYGGGRTMFQNLPTNFPQNMTPEQGAQFNMQSQLQEFNKPRPGPPQGQQQAQGGQGEFMPPGLFGFGAQGSQGGMNFGARGQQGASFENRQPQGQGYQGYDERHEDQNILTSEQFNEGIESNLPDEAGYPNEMYQQEMGFLGEKEPTITRKRPSNLYTAVLSGKKREDSTPNSPSLSILQKNYFSAASTPRSAYDQGGLDTPLSQSGNEFAEESNPPLSEDMIENFRLEDHLGELVEFAKTYNGSRILQKFFPKANQNQVEQVIQEIEDKLEELMLDPYANYMFQTLAQSCSGDQRYFLLKKISPSMVEISCDRKGTHSLQALIALVSRESEEQLLRDTLKDHIVELSFDPQGTHLIQKLIVSISNDNIDFIFEPLVNRFVEVANHSFGLCGLKQLITKIDKIPEMRRRLIRLLYDNLENLIQNPYGNYALQHALDTYQGDCNPLFEKTFDRIVQYSNQKFSSNVIEKCLVITSLELKRRFVQEIIRNDRIAELMKNKYGNFVLLKALKSVDTEDRQVIMQSLMRNLNSVSMAKYKNSWTKFIEENPLRVPSAQTKKHSLFRHNSGNSENMTSTMEKENVDMQSKSFEGWNDPRKDNLKNMPKGLGGEEKSRFYQGNVGGFGGNMTYAEDLGKMGFGDYSQEEREGGVSKENIMDMRMAMGSRDNQQMGAKKGMKVAHNQKFYDDKNQHSNKWGFNNFY